MEKHVGRVTHYYNRINVAVLELFEELKLGDEIHILGRITDVTQMVTSMEIDHQKVDVVVAGQDVALKVEDYVRKGDDIFKIVSE